MKIPLAVTAMILFSLITILLFSSVPFTIISELLAIIILPPTIMIIAVYFRAIEKVKGILDTRLSKSKFYSLKRRPTDSELVKCYIGKNENNERKTSKFFKLFVALWGFSTSLVSYTVQIGTYLGVDKLPQINIKPIFQIPPQYVAHIPAPDNPESFILWMYMFGLPLAIVMIVPAFLLRTTNLCYKNNDGKIDSIPKYNWDLISGVLGIVGFTSLFFKDILTSSFIQVQIMSYLILDLIIVGIPAVIFCLFYVWYLEPKLKPKILSYLLNDLHIREENKQQN